MLICLNKLRLWLASAPPCLASNDVLPLCAQMRFHILRGIKNLAMKRINAVNRNYAQTITTAEAQFKEIEFSANRALAYAILAAEARNRYVMFYRLHKVLAELEKFISFLTPDYLETLTGSQEHRIGLCMQKEHTILARSFRSPGADTIVHFPLLRNLVSRLQKRTDDLADILEGMFLAGDSQPKALIGCLRGPYRSLPQDAFARKHNRW